ncbi:hypothetical protein ACONUD_11975 [Microbulbifer harenosus]|uniref:Chemotaxis protein n=1 Tax=Microbulbifer harenosus TaxID=2576840 RepID=A0ABY2UH50_9GAMM|nr:hypothetical protein [Microbulbifer harenosus]TLM77186.1 hypothetical protein FDY93_09575 [Microbulbifer harenosus]
MKIILKEYLASLKERGDLDKSVLPNLLSEIGLRVLNTPMIGTRQNGVDIAAVGKVKGEDKHRYLYLFCIKAGNISRSDWSTGIQAVRPELDEIRDVYLRSNIAREYVDLPIKICLCCGGELEETALMNWAGYTDRYTTEKVSYEEWNGDRLADLMMRCLLARELLEEEPRRNFQKAVAMVNEPDACYEYTRAFLGNLLREEPESKKDQLLKLRQSFICLHAVIAWAIDAKNLESAYKVSEIGMLFCWNAIRKRDQKKRPTKHDNALMFILNQFLKLYLMASEIYFEKTAYAYGGTPHALSVAVRSRESVDVNLAMFELLGRLAIRGIWTDLFFRGLPDADPEFLKSLAESTNRTLDTMVSVINSNPTLSSPIRDDHMIEIALVMYLSQLTQSESRFLPWLKSISHRTTFALITNSQYPTCLSEYADLIEHPESSEQSYLDEACVGSILYPYVYFWMQYMANEKDTAEFTERLMKKIPNCTHQAWFPDEDSDDLIWCGETYHGVCVTDVSPHNGHEALVDTLNKSIETCTAITEISAVKAGLIPMFLTACRHYRLPIPPNFWFLCT